MWSDAELITIARRGDVTGLGLLFERYQAPLYGSALRMLGHSPDAQDAVHDTFIVAMRRLDQLREPAAVGGWLHAILHNVCQMRRRGDRQELPLGESSQETAARENVEDEIDALALRDWVWTALGNLPEGLQTVVVLRYFGTCSTYEQIAATLGLPIGTVKSRLNTAKSRLAEELLNSVSEAHDEARQVAEQREDFFVAAYQEHNLQGSYDILASAYAAKLSLSISGNPDFLGDRTFVLGDIQSDLDAGRKVIPTRVISSRDVSVLDVAVENGADTPFHCPPRFSQVAVYRDNRIHRLYWYLASAPTPGDSLHT